MASAAEIVEQARELFGADLGDDVVEWLVAGVQVFLDENGTEPEARQLASAMVLSCCLPISTVHCASKISRKMGGS